VWQCRGALGHRGSHHDGVRSCFGEARAGRLPHQQACLSSARRCVPSWKLHSNGGLFCGGSQCGAQVPVSVSHGTLTLSCAIPSLKDSCTYCRSLLLITCAVQGGCGQPANPEMQTWVDVLHRGQILMFVPSQMDHLVGYNDQNFRVQYVAWLHAAAVVDQ
jgi:hypothetical protein